MFEQYLNQTCIIKRNASSSVDRYNANAYALATVGSDVPCRLVEKSVKLMVPRTEEYTWVKANVLLFYVGTDVQTRDEITLNGTTYNVKQMLNRQRGNEIHHVSCIVEALNV